MRLLALAGAVLLFAQPLRAADAPKLDAKQKAVLDRIAKSRQEAARLNPKIPGIVDKAVQKSKLPLGLQVRAEAAIFALLVRNQNAADAEGSSIKEILADALPQLAKVRQADGTMAEDPKIKKAIMEVIREVGPALSDAMPGRGGAADTAQGQQQPQVPPPGPKQDGRQHPPPPQDFGTALGEGLVSTDPADPRSREFLGSQYYAGGDYKGAFQQTNQAIEGGRVNDRNLVLRGLAAQHLGDYEAAHRDAQAALQLNPENADAKSLFLMTDGKVSRVRLAARANPWETSADADDGGARPSGGALGDLPPARGARAYQGSGAGTPQAAGDLVREAQRALKLDPVAAAALATRAVLLDPKNAQAYHVRAVAEAQQGLYSEALRDMDAALALLGPDTNAAALDTRSLALSGLRRYPEALRDAEAALRLNPSDGRARINKARALGGLHRRAEMLELLREAAQAEPESYGPLYQQAVRLPEDADADVLFAGLGKGVAGRPAAPARSGAWHFVLYSLLGGILIGLGLLHIGSRASAKAARSAQGGAADGAAEQPGSFWSLYKDRRELAKGGMGIVYEAMDKALGRRVAIKRMREEIRADPHERERFLKEARTVASLKHPSIVQIFQVAEEGPDVYLVFEHVKPANVMIDREGRVKVMDFGIARQAEDAMAKVAMTNTVAGTPPYMAPEQEQGLVCKQSDIFGLGVLAYQMLAGCLPFEGPPGTMRLAKMSGQFEPLTKRAQGLPAGVDAVLTRAMKPEPTERFAKPSEFFAALAALG